MLAAGVQDVGIGWLGVAFAFGLTVVVMVYAVGHIPGGHFNPAVSLGLWVGRRFDRRELLPYIGIKSRPPSLRLQSCSSSPVVPTGSRRPTDSLPMGTAITLRAADGIIAALVAEVVLTFVFVLVILGATDKRAPAGFAAIAIGLALTGVHLVGFQ